MRRTVPASSRPDLFVLSDRGIRQALERGLFSFEPELEDFQIQPVSIDMLVRSIELGDSLEGGSVYFPPSEMKLHPHRKHDVACTQRFNNPHWSILKYNVDLRSTLRRLSCFSHFGIPMLSCDPLDTLAVEVTNYGPLTIQMKPRDKFAQLLLYFEERDDRYEFSEGECAREYYRKIRDCDHGIVIATSDEVRELHSEGLFHVEPSLKLHRGLIEVHAKDTLQVMQSGVEVEFSGRKDLSKHFTPSQLPYALGPLTFVDVPTLETFQLSKQSNSTRISPILLQILMKRLILRSVFCTLDTSSTHSTD